MRSSSSSITRNRVSECEQSLSTEFLQNGAGSLQGMQPAVPDRPAEDEPWLSADDVGAFEPGTPFSRWALARYIVGRVILERVSWSLLAVAGVLIVLAGLAEWGLNSTFLTVVLGLIAVFVLLLRAALRAVLKRLMVAGAYGPLEARLGAIVDGARKDVLVELRRVGLPSRLLTLPLLAMRLIGRRRKETIARMREFDVDRAVPKARRDELHMVLREAVGRNGTA
jgi:hypothetical protein